jgi:hypothetical protein
MIKFLYTITSLFLATLFSSLQSQSLTGFYTGEAKIIGQRTQFGTQLDLMEEGNEYVGVFRLRAIENNQVTGCDYLVSGQWIKDKLELKLLTTIKETAVPSGGCNIFSIIKLTVDTSGQDPAFKGTLSAYSGRENIAKTEMKLVDREPSFTIDEEIMEGKRLISETFIANAPDDSTRIALMLGYREMVMVDSVELGAGEAFLDIEAPDADLYHKLTLLVNNNLVLFNKAPKQQGIRLRLKDLPEGATDLIFICYHYMLTVTFPVKVTVSYESGTKSFNFPVSVFQNKTLRIIKSL